MTGIYESAADKTRPEINPGETPGTEPAKNPEPSKNPDIVPTVK